MSDGDKIWIAQNGQKSGPFSEADVRRWMAEGRFGPDTLAWRKGLSEWVPLISLFPADAATPPPPPRPSANASPAAFSAEERPGATHTFDQQGPAYAAPPEYAAETETRGSLPAPPSLHWGLVLLFSFLTFGIFSAVWSLIQASWVRKIDEESKATLLLAGALGCLVVSEIVSVGHTTSALGGLLSLAYFVLWIVAFFSMADSIKRKLADYELPVEIGGVTLFFFNTLYLQGQLSRIARWKNTGSSEPQAPKGVFWLLLIPAVFAIAILAAIAIPAYQGYVHRAHALQVAPGG